MNYKCLLCNEKFKNRKAARKHMKAHTNMEKNIRKLLKHFKEAEYERL